MKCRAQICNLRFKTGHTMAGSRLQNAEAGEWGLAKCPLIQRLTKNYLGGDSLSLSRFSFPSPGGCFSGATGARCSGRISRGSGFVSAGGAGGTNFGVVGALGGTTGFSMDDGGLGVGISFRSGGGLCSVGAGLAGTSGVTFGCGAGFDGSCTAGVFSRR